MDDIYPKGSTRREKRIMDTMAMAAFAILIVTMASFAVGILTPGGLAAIVAGIFLILVLMEVVVMKILSRNKGWK